MNGEASFTIKNIGHSSCCHLASNSPWAAHFRGGSITSVRVTAWFHLSFPILWLIGLSIPRIRLHPQLFLSRLSMDSALNFMHSHISHLRRPLSIQERAVISWSWAKVGFPKSCSTFLLRFMKRSRGGGTSLSHWLIFGVPSWYVCVFCAPLLDFPTIRLHSTALDPHCAMIFCLLFSCFFWFLCRHFASFSSTAYNTNKTILKASNRAPLPVLLSWIDSSIRVTIHSKDDCTLSWVRSAVCKAGSFDPGWFALVFERHSTCQLLWQPVRR
jgi:hypothetical protein